jgi:phenylalanyl-tRNA synthetase beta chain
MNISYTWLKELIDIDLPAEDLGQRLTDVGLAVEGIHTHGDDLVFDIDLTSNRPDCLSHLGVAREVAVIAEKNLNAKTQSSKDAKESTIGKSSLVSIQDPELCHRFTARIIRNVKVGPSPQWMVDRLEAIGERSINNVADITNYVMHELGQPMHSFDLDKLAENRIVVRRAKAGETIRTLDEAERKLDDSMLAICDAEKPVAIGGVMGGLDTGISDSTVNVLLEVAYFTRENIRATSRKLGLATEASYRFERGIDIENLGSASHRAAGLMAELAGGDAGEFVDVYPTEFKPNLIESHDIRTAVHRLTGLSVETHECERILESLGIAKAGPTVYFSPSWRHDLAIEEDLVEEVARHEGYAQIADELPPAFGAGEYQATEHREKLLRQKLADIGFDEALTYSFIDTRFDDVFESAAGLVNENAGEKFVTLQNSVIEGAVRMRPSLLPGLLDAVRLNLNHQRRDLKLFELGKAFAAGNGEDGLPVEQEFFSLVLTGGEVLQDKAMPVRELDLYDAKGAVEAALEAAGAPNAVFEAAEVKHLRKGQSAAIFVNGDQVGYLGRLSDDIAAQYKFKQPVFVAELNLQRVLDAGTAVAAYQPLAKFPSIVRDVSFVARRDVTFSSIRDAIVEQQIDLCRGVSFVDVYEGKGLAADERSITIRLAYRSDERTLVEDDVAPIHQQIVLETEKKLGVKHRI